MPSPTGSNQQILLYLALTLAQNKSEGTLFSASSGFSKRSTLYSILT